MNTTIETARDEITALVESNPVTAGLQVRVRGKILTLAREDEWGRDDRVRLTHLGSSQFGLSVMRHTGKWERTPFAGTVPELFEVISGPMQHLVSEWT